MASMALAALLAWAGCDDSSVEPEPMPSAPDADGDGAPDGRPGDAGPGGRDAITNDIVDAAPTPDLFRPPPSDAGRPLPDVGPLEALDLRALMDAYEAGAVSLAELEPLLRDPSEALAPSVVRTLSDAIDRPVLLAAGASARVEAPLTITADGLLVLAPSSAVELDDGVRVTVDGRLYAIGGPGAEVRVSGGGLYDTVELRGGPNGLHHVTLVGGDRLLTVSHPAGTRTRIAHATFDRWVDVALDLPGTDGVSLRESRLGLDSGGDVGGEIVRARRSGGLRFEGNHFGPRRGYRDAIDLQDCVGGWPVLIGNHFVGGEDDAIDLDRCSAHVIGNHIVGFRPLDLEDRRAGINGGGITGDGDIDVIIADNVIEGCFHGIGFKNGARPVMVNNTIVDGNIGVSLYQSAAGQPMPHGVMINNLLAGNRDWLTGAPQDIVLHGRWWPTYNQRDEIQATLDASHNTLASGGPLPPGPGNDARDPEIVRLDGLPAPGPGSPAVDSGLGAGFAAEIFDWLRVDIRGAPRAIRGAEIVGVDRGAVER